MVADLLCNGADEGGVGGGSSDGLVLVDGFVPADTVVVDVADGIDGVDGTDDTSTASVAAL